MNKKIILGIFSIFALITSIIFINTISAKKYSSQNNDSQLGVNPPLLVEDFTYPAGSLLTSNNWTAHSGAGTNAIATSAPGLTLSGYPSSGIGNSVALTTSGEDDNRVFPVQTTGSVYAAFMVNVSDASTAAPGGYFFHLGPDPIGTTFRGRVFVLKDASNNIAFGISKASSTEVSFTPFSFALNTTYLVVLKYTIVSGDANDTASITVSSVVPASEPPPAATATDVSAADIAPASVALRQGTAATAPTLRVDGIRIGTSYASVTQSGGTATPTPDANVDFNGDGKSDWVVTRSSGNQLIWYANINGTGEVRGVQWGLNTDRRVPADYDGDGKDDIAVWRPLTTGQPSGNAFFYILQSQTNTVRIEDFGQNGDDWRVVGDYDGDGKDDPAVYRQNAGSQNFFYFRGSLNNPNGNITFVPWGSGIFVSPNYGDYDGDGKADFCIQSESGVFSLLKSSGGIEYIRWGNGTDILVPGDFDGDGKYDFCIVRGVDNVYNWYILERDGGGTGVSPILWGITADQITPGDYDGDGKQDVGIWRPSEGTFYIRNSGTNSLTGFKWGQMGDNADANWYVHQGGSN
ncbi:hypothetical protein BH20ACI4_BH20ACI4_14950 [soil metagenome]